MKKPGSGLPVVSLAARIVIVYEPSPSGMTPLSPKMHSENPDGGVPLLRIQSASLAGNPSSMSGEASGTPEPAVSRPDELLDHSLPAALPPLIVELGLAATAE